MTFKEQLSISPIVFGNDLSDIFGQMQMCEQRVIAVLISKVRMEDDQFHNYRIPLNIFSPSEQCSGSLYESYREVFNGLMTKEFRIKGKLIKVLGFLECPKHRGYVNVRLCDDLKDYLLHQSQRFTKLSYSIFQNFKSHFTSYFYCLFKNASAKNKKRVMTLKNLKEVLGLSGKYASFSDFRNRVVLPVLRELKRVLGMEVSFSFEEAYDIEDSRLVFEIDKVSEIDIYKKEKPVVKSTENINKAVEKKPAETSPELPTAFSRFFTAKEYADLCKEHEPAYLEYAFKQTNFDQANNKVAYFRSILTAPNIKGGYEHLKMTKDAKKGVSGGYQQKIQETKTLNMLKTLYEGHYLNIKHTAREKYDSEELRNTYLRNNLMPKRHVASYRKMYVSWKNGTPTEDAINAYSAWLAVNHYPESEYKFEPFVEKYYPDYTSLVKG
ncbi:replication initiation protein [Persicobacter psychrovividus]|uniref:Initiator Rep protein WH1 domain-containing protein n=1 Tax=Persicobacter psychrovividus TaxID=387638 RepID=A0ABN6LLF8_9BACT|nr:hypothetical protein PEPS_47270 [Persicobacter psychrovividus]